MNEFLLWLAVRHVAFGGPDFDCLGALGSHGTSYSRLETLPLYMSCLTSQAVQNRGSRFVPLLQKEISCANSPRSGRWLISGEEAG